MIKYKSNYKVDIEFIDGEKKHYEFDWWQSNVLREHQRPNSPNGANFIESGAHVFVPWHQIKRFSCVENIIGEAAI